MFEHARRVHVLVFVHVPLVVVIPCLLGIKPIVSRHIAMKSTADTSPIMHHHKKVEM